MTVRFTFPLPPQRANARGHWRVDHTAKTRFWAHCDELQNIGRLPAPPAVPWQRAEAEARCYLWNPMDQGNLLSRMKWIEDWLVTRGYLVDDRARNLVWISVPEQAVTRKRKGEWTLGPMRVELSLGVT